ncbi:hypothetical protein FOXYSP1_13033 [Fusarium oxysporum f. sp. phaseoli]
MQQRIPHRRDLRIEACLWTAR